MYKIRKTYSNRENTQYNNTYTYRIAIHPDILTIKSGKFIVVVESEMRPDLGDQISHWQYSFALIVEKKRGKRGGSK